MGGKSQCGDGLWLRLSPTPDRVLKEAKATRRDGNESLNNQRNYTHVTHEHQFLAESGDGELEGKGGSEMRCLAQTHAEEMK
jgi:hypothetical protein